LSTQTSLSSIDLGLCVQKKMSILQIDFNISRIKDLNILKISLFGFRSRNRFKDDVDATEVSSLWVDALKFVYNIFKSTLDFATEGWFWCNVYLIYLFCFVLFDSTINISLIKTSFLFLFIQQHSLITTIWHKHHLKY